MSNIDTPVRNVEELQAMVGRKLPTSDWVLIDQALIDRFADVTGDRMWVHVDKARAAKSLPDGKTIAHGYLIQSLVAGLTPHLFPTDVDANALSYGSNRVRYPTVTQVGDRVRLHSTLDKVERTGRGAMITRTYTMEIEGKAKPALVGEMLTLLPL